MQFDNRPISEIKPEEIVGLVEEEKAEYQHLEYKQEPYRLLNKNDQDREKQIDEMLKDIASMANVEGGYIIIGIVEENKIAKDFNNVENAERICESINQCCLKYIESPIPDLEVIKKDIVRKGISYTVIIIHIPPSSEKPHGIRRNNTTSFVKRHGSLIRDMSVSEITSYSKSNKLDDIERIANIKSKMSAQDNPLEQRLPETLIHLMNLRFQKNFPDIPYYRIVAVPESLDPDLMSSKQNDIISIISDPPRPYIRKTGFGFLGLVGKVMHISGGWIGEGVNQQKIILLQNGFIELQVPLLSRFFQWRKNEVMPNTKDPWLYPYAVCEYPVSFLRLINTIYAEIGINCKIHIQQEYWHIDDFILVAGHPGNIFFSVDSREDKHRHHLGPDQPAITKRVIEPDFIPDQVAYDLVKEIYSYFGLDERSLPLFDENHRFTP